MIEEFSFGNFRSFKDIQTLNMSAAKIKSKNPQMDVDNVIHINDKLSLLKSKAIYGANASGKSNVVKALVVFLKILKHSFKNGEVLEMIDEFQLSSETENEPSFFQIIFRVDDIKYRYGFETSDTEIKSEWLFSVPKMKEQPLFIRDGNKIIKTNKTHLPEIDKVITLFGDVDDDENNIFGTNSLFLSSLQSVGFAKKSKHLYNKLTNNIDIISGLGDDRMYSFARTYLDKSEINKKFIVDFLKLADTGIDNLDEFEISQNNLPENTLDEIRQDYTEGKNISFLVSQRMKYDANLKEKKQESFSFTMFESEGTKKMFELSPFIHRSLNEGRTLIIDEFDARFHPLITKKIVELYNSPKNDKNAQLIFVTHDTNLLSNTLLRRDQIDFVEKDRYGASYIYTLIEIKGVRNNASFENDYITGRYGAIPFLGNIDTIF